MVWNLDRLAWATRVATFTTAIVESDRIRIYGFAALADDVVGERIFVGTSICFAELLLLSSDRRGQHRGKGNNGINLEVHLRSFPESELLSSDDDNLSRQIAE